MAASALPLDSAGEALDAQGQPAKQSLAARDARVRELVDAHFAFVWRLVRRLGVPEADVDDSVQQVFWVATRKLDSIFAGRERAFLGGTAIRVASDARRALRRRTPDGSKDVAEMGDPALGPEELTDRLRARRILDQVLDELSPDLRTAFVLFELEQLTTPEIAALLELPLGTAASRLRRAREAFRKAVAQWREQTGGHDE